MSSTVFDCDSSLFHVLIGVTDLCAQKSVHFLQAEPSETDILSWNLLKFGPEIPSFAPRTAVSVVGLEAVAVCMYHGTMVPGIIGHVLW